MIAFVKWKFPKIVSSILGPARIEALSRVKEVTVICKADLKSIGQKNTWNGRGLREKSHAHSVLLLFPTTRSVKLRND